MMQIKLNHTQHTVIMTSSDVTIIPEIDWLEGHTQFVCCPNLKPAVVALLVKLDAFTYRVHRIWRVQPGVGVGFNIKLAYSFTVDIRPQDYLANVVRECEPFVVDVPAKPRDQVIPL